MYPLNWKLIEFMIRTRLKGMGVALITPFKEDDSVDYDALLRLVDYQLQNGTDFLCVLGTTAETPTLTSEEKLKIKNLVVERVNGQLPILLGVGSNCTRTVIETLHNEEMMRGVDAVLVAVPYYNKKDCISITRPLPNLPTCLSYFIMYQDVQV